ncbi:hypothetical protein HHK36_008156 [Tetracentron sinense]|uniref:Uncharacterized protein n=1 Tax=Tetracentron sinense TaxID=13715 RepID=A0A834ZFV8_TETSI|nr:hypothetical protein HHK36_008156 [Tetracentron sinense]
MNQPCGCQFAHVPESSCGATNGDWKMAVRFICFAIQNLEIKFIATTFGVISRLMSNKGNSGVILMSNEELKIRGELEMDIERDLEEEIKDGICRLALRLQRLYQHQRGRSATTSSAHSTEVLSGLKNSKFSKVNITIRMEGKSKIEINKIKKVDHKRGRLWTAKSEDKQGELSPGAKKFDWVTTLRSGTSPNLIYKKHGISDHARSLRKDPKVYPNLKLDI